MNDSNKEILDKELHKSARNLVKNLANKYSVSLILGAKLAAYEDDSEIVLSNHVKLADERGGKGKGIKKTNRILIAFGGALLGAFVQGFINELSLEVLRPGWIAIYVISGFVGGYMVFKGIYE